VEFGQGTEEQRRSTTGQSGRETVPVGVLQAVVNRYVRCHLSPRRHPRISVVRCGWI